MRRLIPSWVLAAFLLAGMPAHADTESDAKEAYKLGREFYVQGKYPEALVQLKRAYDLKPHPALLKYMGDTCFKMNQAKPSLEFYNKYLAQAPQAADRAQVEAKVVELQRIIGDSEQQAAATQAQPPSVPGEAAGAGAGAAAQGGQASADEGSAGMAPTGDDREVPIALTQEELTPKAEKKGGVSVVSVLKWTALGLGVGSLGMGIAFNRLAAGDAGELEDMVKKTNPNMNDPLESYNEQHHELYQSYKNNNTLALVGFIAGSTLIATSGVLFWLDRKPGSSQERQPPQGNVSVAPVFGAGLLGLAAEVGF